jgi:hypothetical protein
LADNVELNAGTGGATVSTDDAGVGGHVQRVKLTYSADGSAVHIPADADGLLVKLTAQGGVDLGDVTVNNGTGASSVPTQGAAAHDAVVAGNPLLLGGYAKAAAPTDVSADGDAVRAWFLLNGALTTAITAAGALIGGDAANGLDVDVTRSALPSGASTSAKQDTAQTALDAIKTALEIIDNVVSGSEAQVDIVAALPAGTNAIGKLAANSGVDIGDVTLTAGTAAIGTLLPPDIDVTTHTNYAKKYYTSAGAATDGIVWSPAAGKRWHVVTLIVNVSAAATVTFEDDKAGGDEAVMKFEFAANSGTVINFGEKYPWASGEDAADLLVTTSAGNVYITAVGYEI